MSDKLPEPYWSSTQTKNEILKLVRDFSRDTEPIYWRAKIHANAWEFESREDRDKHRRDRTYEYITLRSQQREQRTHERGGYER